ncbi:MAG: glutamate racemase, partial [Myxococcota bacterium]
TRLESLDLGCTHYLLLKPLIQKVVGPNVTLIDSGVAVAKSIDAVTGSGDWRFFATDVSDRVHRVGQAFLGERMPEVELVDL